MESVPHYLSDQQWQILLGGLMGDSALSFRQGGHAARLRWGHGAKQAEYGDWKMSLFENVGVCRTTNAKGAVFYDFKPLAELAELRRVVYMGGGKKTITDEYLKALTPLALAVWFMDDGTFIASFQGPSSSGPQGGSGRVEICVEAFTEGSQRRIVEYLRDTHGLDRLAGGMLVQARK